MSQTTNFTAHDDSDRLDYATLVRRQATVNNVMYPRLSFLPLGDHEAPRMFFAPQGGAVSCYIEGLGFIADPALIIAATLTATLGWDRTVEVIARNAEGEKEYRSQTLTPASEIPAEIQVLGGIVVDSLQTLAHVQRTIGSMGDPLGRNASSILVAAGVLPYNPVVCVLASALMRKYYVPDALTGEQFAPFAHLMGMDLASHSSVSVQKAIFASLSETNGEPTVPSMLGKLTTENMKVFSNFIPTAKMRIIQHGAIEGFAAYLHGLEVVDPQYRAAAIHDGELAAIDGVEVLGERTVALSLPGSFAVKDRESLTLLDVGSSKTFDASVLSVRGSAGSPHVTVEVEKKKSRITGNDDPVLYSNGLLVYKSIFGSFASKKMRGRWSNASRKPVTERKMPASLAAALGSM